MDGWMDGWMDCETLAFYRMSFCKLPFAVAFQVQSLIKASVPVTAVFEVIL